MHTSSLAPAFATLLLALQTTISIAAPLNPTALSSLTASPFSKSSKFISQSSLAPNKPPKKTLKTSTSNTFLDLDDDLNPTLNTKNRSIVQQDGNNSDSEGLDIDDTLNPGSWDDYSYTYKFNGADGTTTTTTRSNVNPSENEGSSSSGSGYDSEGTQSVTVGGKNKNRKGEVQGFELDTDEIVNNAIWGDKTGKGKKVGDVLRGWLPKGNAKGARKVQEEVYYEASSGGEDAGYDSMAAEAGSEGEEGYQNMTGWSDDEGSSGEKEEGHECGGQGEESEKEEEKFPCGNEEGSKYMDADYMSEGTMGMEEFEASDAEDNYGIGIADRSG